MPLLPEETVRAYVAGEMPAARAWAARNGCELDFDEQALALSMKLSGPASDDNEGEPYLLKGTFDDYRALPPCWWMAHPLTGADIGPAAYPKHAQPHPRNSPLFITAGPTGAAICAHFNRLSYKENAGTDRERDGIHADWGEPTNWLTLPPDQYTRAETIADMLARIAVEVADSIGRMALLP